MRLIVEAGYVAQPGGGLLEGQALLIEDGRVIAIAPGAELAVAEADRRLGGPDCLALPGFVNGHQHGRCDSTVALGVPDAPLECWLASLLGLPFGDPYTDTLRLCRSFAAAGVTTAVHSHYTVARTGEDYEAELRAVLAGYRDGGVRGIVAADLRDRGQPVYGAESEFLERLPAELAERVSALVGPPLPLEAALEVVAGLRAEIRADRLGDVELIYGPPGPPWCSDRLLARVAEVSEAQGACVHTHLLETWYEREFGLREYAEGTVGALERLGLLNERLFVAHGVWLDEPDREALAAAGTSVVTNPSSNLRLHAGIAPVPELLDAGVNVALGTDNMALGEREEFLDELRLLRALHRRPGIDERGLPPAALLTIATEAGGRAVGRHDIGFLEAGAPADAVLVDLARLRRPGRDPDPLELAFATAGNDDLCAVVAGGRIVAEDGVPSLPEPVSGSVLQSTAAVEVVEAMLPYACAHFRAWSSDRVLT